MSELPSLEQQRTATLDVLTNYSAVWLDYRVRVERTLGLDAKLNSQYDGANEHMNYLLERYFSLIAGVELDIPLLTEEDRLEEIREQEKDLAQQEYGQD